MARYCLMILLVCSVLESQAVVTESFCSRKHNYTTNFADRNSNELQLFIRTAFDSDLTCNFSDKAVSRIRFDVISNSGSQVFFFEQGDSILMNLVPGEYLIVPTLENELSFQFLPEEIKIDLNENSTIDLCIQARGHRPDGQLSIVPINNAGLNEDVCYVIQVENIGNTSIFSRLSLSFDPQKVTMVSSSIDPQSSLDGEIIWLLDELQPFEVQAIEVCFTIHSDSNSIINSNVLKYRAELTLGGDINSSNNLALLDHEINEISGTNYKACLEGDEVQFEESGTSVSYIIRFKNLTTSDVRDVKIIDYLDTTVFDINTFYPVSASHSYRSVIIGNNKVEFTFESINLRQNVEENDGYIQFRIQTHPNLQVGDTLLNQAEIYFDTDDSIPTNIERTILIDENSVSANQINHALNVVTFPNPTSGVVHIDVGDAVIQQLVLFNSNGQEIKRFSSVSQIDIAELPSGSYFLMIGGPEGHILNKILKR